MSLALGPFRGGMKMKIECNLPIIGLLVTLISNHAEKHDEL
jgi:hypothetical protein